MWGGRESKNKRGVEKGVYQSQKIELRLERWTETKSYQLTHAIRNGRGREEEMMTSP